MIVTKILLAIVAAILFVITTVLMALIAVLGSLFTFIPSVLIKTGKDRMARKSLKE